jgi:hypothetical protein
MEQIKYAVACICKSWGLPNFGKAAPFVSTHPILDKIFGTFLFLEFYLKVRYNVCLANEAYGHEPNLKHMAFSLRGKTRAGALRLLLATEANILNTLRGIVSN